MTDILPTHRESFEERNVRFLGYNFLKDVRYNGEPVVPVIISETVNTEDPHTNVEELGGWICGNSWMTSI